MGKSKKVELTPREKEVLRFIEKSLKQRGAPPTVRELARYLGVKSPATAYGYIKSLTEKGYIRRRKSASGKYYVARSPQPASKKSSTRKHSHD